MNFYSLMATTTLLLALGACGGGSSDSDSDSAEGGMGGTGISQGPVTAFGSVYVNGIKYNTDAASFVRNDDSSASQENFSLGEYVTVEGRVNADDLSGVASKITYSSLLQGPVDLVDSNANRLTVLNQQVILDALTVNIGFALLADLQPGNVLEVSGIVTADGVIRASTLRLKEPADAAIKFKGVISNSDSGASQFTLNGITVDYHSAQLDAGIPQNGQTLEVYAAQPPLDNRVAANRVKLESRISYSSNTELEIEGIVTAFSSVSAFSVNDINVTTSNRTEFDDGLASQLQLDSRVKVEGRINAAGVLEADEVELRNSSASVELEGRVESIDSGASRLVLLGKTILIDAGTMLIDDNDVPLRLAQLRIGDMLEVKGNALANGQIRATRIDREDSDDDDADDSDNGGENSKLEGIISSVDRVTFSFTLLGLTVQTTAGTELEADDELNQNDFFALLVAGQTRVEVEGSVAGTVMSAQKVEIDD